MRCLFLSLAMIPTTMAVSPTLPTGRVVLGEPTIINEIDPQQEKCLATMVYGEARGEPELGQVAVAYTALNRAKNRSVCDVILAPKQYSIFNDNPSLRAAAMSLEVNPKHKNIVDEWAWEKAKQVAQVVMRKKVPDPTKGSTHYLAPIAMAALDYKYPKWASQYRLVTVIHGHKFYKYAPPPKEKRNVVVSI